ncbi:unnamed protein product [Ixodes hexagonus]
MAATTKRKRLGVSKNRKKTWVKHSDIKDIEVFLDDQRLDERLGGAVSTKPDEELFYVDKTPAAPKPKRAVQSKRERRNRKLTCYLNLEPSSKVAPPTKPRKVRDPEERKPAAVRRVQQQRLAKRHVQAVTQRLRSVARKAKQVNGHSDFTGLRDVWADEEKKGDSVLDPELETYIAEYTKERRPNIPAHRYQKPSLLPAVQPPHPGASYNPDPEAHQELLHEAFLVEQKRLKEEQHIDRVLTKMLPTRETMPTEQDMIAQMSQGLYDDPSSDEAEGDEVPGDEGGDRSGRANPPVRAEDRKTKQKRRRELEQKRIQRAAKVRKTERVLANQVYRIPTLKAELKREAEISEERQKRRQEREDDKLYQANRLSKHKFEEPDMELKLPEELTESLRQLKPECNVLEDRYKSMQKRNVIETRKRQKKVRKYKPKKALKREHRLFKEAEEKRWSKELQ